MCYTTFPSISPLHTHIHIICLLPFSSQACQYVKSESADYPLGKVDTDTTWEVSDPSDETFTFVITYKNGQKTSEGRDRYIPTFSLSHIRTHSSYVLRPV